MLQRVAAAGPQGRQGQRHLLHHLPGLPGPDEGVGGEGEHGQGDLLVRRAGWTVVVADNHLPGCHQVQDSGRQSDTATVQRNAGLYSAVLQTRWSQSLYERSVALIWNISINIS